VAATLRTCTVWERHGAWHCTTSVAVGWREDRQPRAQGQAPPGPWVQAVGGAEDVTVGYRLVDLSLQEKAATWIRRNLKPACSDQTKDLSSSSPISDKAKSTGCLEEAVRTGISQAREAGFVSEEP